MFKRVLNLDQNAKVTKIYKSFYFEELNLSSSKVIKFHFIPYFRFGSTVFLEKFLKSFKEIFSDLNSIFEISRKGQIVQK